MVRKQKQIVWGYRNTILTEACFGQGGRGSDRGQGRDAVGGALRHHVEEGTPPSLLTGSSHYLGDEIAVL